MYLFVLLANKGRSMFEKNTKQVNRMIANMFAAGSLVVLVLAVCSTVGIFEFGPVPDKHGQNDHHKCNTHRKSCKCVYSIASFHKLDKLFSHASPSFFNEMMSLLLCKIIFICHCTPGTHKTSDNKIHLKTTGSDDPVPGSCILPGAVSCVHFVRPVRSSW